MRTKGMGWKMKGTYESMAEKIKTRHRRYWKILHAKEAGVIPRLRPGVRRNDDVFLTFVRRKAEDARLRKF